MRPRALVQALGLAFPLSLSFASSSQAQSTEFAQAPTKSLGVVTVIGSQPTSLPTQIPATMEGVTRSDIARAINATDSEDALKYLPSLLVRKRYIGDYNHAILSSRASGTGNSARSAVYADGILLSNYLGNGVGGLSFPPRWGMVTPEEIDRVDVMYGPFSAAYPGNSVGAVVVFTTAMPKTFEAHAKVGYSSQPFDLYNTRGTFQAWETSLSLGNKAGDWSWFLSLNHSDSQGQPLTFATRLLSTGVAGTAGTPVTGAVLGASNTNAPWYILGTGTEYTTRQDHAKIKLAYDVTPTLRAHYQLGLWQNTSENTPRTYLADAAGKAVYSGAININGRDFTGAQALTGGDFVAGREKLMHVMHGLSLKSHTQGEWDWEANASLYDYQSDLKRQNSTANPLPAAASGGAGTLADGSGTGWTNLALKGTWRPSGLGGEHIVDMGLQQDSYKLDYLTSNIAGNWTSDPAGALFSRVGGKTRLRSAYAQDAWAFAPDWKAVLGLRAEQWSATDGQTISPVPGALNYPERSQKFLSPKAALSFQAAPDLVLKASVGRAVRMPTVSELYGATLTANSQYINDPSLRPERSVTTELSAEKDVGQGLLRVTLFSEDVKDALYSQSVAVNSTSNTTVTRVQNIGRIATQGAELAYSGRNVGVPGLDVSTSVTYADSVIKDNAGFIAVAGDTLGKQQPNIPHWRATALLNYRIDPQWTMALGLRYSGRQYRTLNNADVNGYTYQGVSKFATADVRVRYKFDRQWSAAFGIDNLNNYQYWNFHPYPQRTYNAELKFDL